MVLRKLQPRNVARDQVHLQVHAGAGREVAQVRLAQRDGDDHDVEAGVANARSPSCWLRLWRSTPSRRQRPRAPGGARRTRASASPTSSRETSVPTAVDVAGDEVPAEAVARTQCSLEVDACAQGKAAEGRAGEGLGGGVDGEAVRQSFDDRQARAVHGDGLPQGERLAPELRPNDQPRAGAARRLNAPGQDTGPADEAREHEVGCSDAPSPRPGSCASRRRVRHFPGEDPTPARHAPRPVRRCRPGPRRRRPDGRRDGLRTELPGGLRVRRSVRALLRARPGARVAPT